MVFAEATGAAAQARVSGSGFCLHREPAGILINGASRAPARGPPRGWERQGASKPAAVRMRIGAGHMQTGAGDEPPRALHAVADLQ
jgi:hypothetical protein